MLDISNHWLNEMKAFHNEISSHSCSTIINKEDKDNSSWRACGEMGTLKET